MTCVRWCPSWGSHSPGSAVRCGSPHIGPRPCHLCQTTKRWSDEFRDTGSPVSDRSLGVAGLTQTVTQVAVPRTAAQTPGSTTVTQVTQDRPPTESKVHQGSRRRRPGRCDECPVGHRDTRPSPRLHSEQRRDHLTVAAAHRGSIAEHALDATRCGGATFRVHVLDFFCHRQVIPKTADHGLFSPGKTPDFDQ